ncbi:MAG: glycosyltransferase family 4 protein [Chloroflexota bacterium]
MVSGTFHPEIGGPPTYLYHLLPALVGRGHEITVVAYGDVEGSYEYPFRVVRLSRRPPVPLRLWHFTRQVWRAALDSDLIFVNGYGLPPALVNVWLRKPMVIKLVGDFAWEYAVRHRLIDPDETIDDFQQRSHGRRVRWLRALQRWYISRAQVVIVPSRYLGGLVEGWGVSSGRLRLIYNALDTSLYESLPGREAARQMLDLSGRVVLTVARLTPWKGVDALIALLPHLREQMPDVELVVVGDGPERASLERLAFEKGVLTSVRFTGQISQQQVGLYLRAADLFVLYSGYEGLPHVVLEAMLAGAPVIASAKGGIPEVVEDGVTGRLVPWGDEARLREALLAALSHPDEAAAWAERARVRVARDFGWARLVEETASLLEQLGMDEAIGETT